MMKMSVWDIVGLAKTSDGSNTTRFAVVYEIKEGGLLLLPVTALPSQPKGSVSLSEDSMADGKPLSESLREHAVETDGTFFIDANAAEESIAKNLGRLATPVIDKVIRQMAYRLVSKHFDAVHKPTLEAEFVPGKSGIRYAGRVFDASEINALADATFDFWLTAGRFARKFEKDFSEFLGLSHCALANSGSSANLLAVSALTSHRLGERMLKPGDEVITVACGFPTTVNPIIQNGLVPVFVDVELGTYNARTTALEGALSDSTKAIFLAHTLGNPFDIDKVMKFAKKHDLWVIEDNCDALGSKYDGKYTGTFGDLSTYSFYPAHHITMGEGGAVATNDLRLFQNVESFRDWGRDCWCPPGKDETCGKRFSWQLGTLPYGYDHKFTYSHFGYNLKVTDMQAAVGLAQLDKLEGFIEARKRNHKKIYKGLVERGLDELLILPEALDAADPSWFGFVMALKDGVDMDRAKVVSELERRKIQTRLLFAGNIIRQPLFNQMRESGKGFRVAGELTNTDKAMNDAFWIGVYPGLTDAMIDYMVEQIDDVLRQKN